MTTPLHRRPAAVVVLLVMALLVGCSDAHTEEEKAWSDDGIGPDIVTLFVDPVFKRPAEELVAAYEQTDLAARIVVVAREAEHVAAEVADDELPSVWIASEATFAGRTPDDSAVELGSSPLIIAYPRDGRPAPGLEVFASPGNGTGMCPVGDPCGFSGRQTLANNALTADPDLVADAETLVGQIADGTLESALVHSVAVGNLWLRVVNDEHATDDVALADPWIARAFGANDRTDAFLDWLATSDEARRALSSGGVTIAPGAATEEEA